MVVYRAGDTLEVLARNATIAEPDGTTPDWVELLNPSAHAVDLAGMSLSDTLTEPRRWVFPAPLLLVPPGAAAGQGIER